MSTIWRDTGLSGVIATRCDGSPSPLVIYSPSVPLLLERQTSALIYIVINQNYGMGKNCHQIKSTTKKVFFGKILYSKMRCSVGCHFYSTERKNKTVCYFHVKF